MTSAYDVHQHLWPETVLRVLELRSDAPRAVWRQGRWEISLEAEPAFEVDPRDHDLGSRAEGLARQGVDRALVALSCPVGADSLLSAASAWNELGDLLPGELGWWAAVPHPHVADRAELAREALGNGAAGVCLPAAELGSPRPSEGLHELLDVLERESAPLLTVTIAPEAIHRVRHVGEEPAVSLHAYSPPLRRVGTYEVAENGALLRHPRPSETPLEAAA